MARTKVETTGGETLTVACKHPGGLVLQLHEWGEVTEPSPSGPRAVRVARKVGKPVIVKGPSLNWFDADYRRKVDFDIIGPYALTPGVPADFWRLWLEQYKTSDLVKNRVVFAADPASVKSQCRELEKTRSGFEPLDPTNLQKSGGRDRLAVETADVR
jgi:hypothetical protein